MKKPVMFHRVGVKWYKELFCSQLVTLHCVPVCTVTAKKIHISFTVT